MSIPVRNLDGLTLCEGLFNFTWREVPEARFLNDVRDMTVPSWLDRDIFRDNGSLERERSPEIKNDDQRCAEAPLPEMRWTDPFLDPEFRIGGPPDAAPLHLPHPEQQGIWIPAYTFGMHDTLSQLLWIGAEPSF